MTDLGFPAEVKAEVGTRTNKGHLEENLLTLFARPWSFFV
jgi:hypothetical protein